MVKFATISSFQLWDQLKEVLQSVLRIGFAHNKGGPPNINIFELFLN